MILVTGATGNVGAELVPQLLDQGLSVRVLTRDPGKVAAFGSRVEIAVGDYTQPETLRAAMQGVDKLFLMFAGMGDGHAAAATAAAKESGVKHIVLLSSTIASMPNVALGRWHHEREEYVRQTGIASTILRPGGFMSNALQWVGSIKSQGTVFFPGGQVSGAPMDPYDIAAVAAAALTQPGHEGKTYDLSGPDLLTAADQVGILARLLDKPIQCVEVPPAAAREGMLRNGLPPVLVDSLLEITERLRDSGFVFHSDTGGRILGRKLRTFAQWCEAHIAAFQ